MPRRILIVLLSLVAVLLLIAGGAVAWLVRADHRALVESFAADELGRRVHLGSLTIGWGDPVTISIRDLRIANAPWGSTEDMVTLGSLDAALDRTSLWAVLHGGTPVYRRLRAERLKVVLERDDAGTGNWKFGGGGGGGGGGIVPKDRSGFPTLIDMALTDSLVTYRTFSGNILRIGLDRVAIASPDAASPVALEAEGAYNDTPLTLTATTESFQLLRDASHPFGTDLTIAGRTARLDFDGTLMEPLDVDGADGRLHVQAPELDNLLAAFGAGMAAPYPFLLDSHLARTGDRWEFGGIEASVAEMPFTGDLTLIEGSRGSPDDIRAELAFAEMNVDRLLVEGSSEGSSGDWREMQVPAPDGAGIKLDLSLTARTFSYRGIALGDFSGRARLGDGKAALEKVAFGLGGGEVHATFESEAQEGGNRLLLDAEVAGLDADRLAQHLGAPAGDISGRVDGALALAAAGSKLADILRASSGDILLGLRDGRIKESIIEMASTDLRALFRDETDSAPLNCLGLHVSLSEGRALVSPLRLEAEGASLSGGGWIDLSDGGLDIRIKSDRSESGFFALDLPVAIGGTLDEPKAGLAAKDSPPLDLPVAGGDPLPASMQQLRAENPCLN